MLLFCEYIKNNKFKFAPVAELADALDLGSSVPDVKVQVLSGAPNKKSLQNLSVSFFRACFCQADTSS